MFQKNVLFIELLCLALFSTSCASIVQGTSQSVGISSTPTGANVTVNNMDKGKTPLVVELKRKNDHIIKIEMDGYLPYSTTLTKKASGWVWGNIVFGGIIGVAIDAMTGGMYKLTPEQVEVTLSKSDTAQFQRENDLVILTVLRPDSSWEKIDQLNKLN